MQSHEIKSNDDHFSQMAWFIMIMVVLDGFIRSSFQVIYTYFQLSLFKQFCTTWWKLLFQYKVMHGFAVFLQVCFFQESLQLHILVCLFFLLNQRKLYGCMYKYAKAHLWLNNSNIYSSNLNLGCELQMPKRQYDSKVLNLLPKDYSNDQP